nr:YheC/YheD family protein [Paenibacillus hamazuiensis]
MQYRRHIISKWLKTKALLANPKLHGFVPDTRKMNRNTLKTMLDQYKMVYVKPDIGTFGNGVMRVEYKAGDAKPYSYQSGTAVRSFASYDAMYESIRKSTRKRGYLAQKGIQLLKYKKRRFDLRVMVQQTPKKTWETTGVIGRVAHPNKIVTNFHNGGTLTPVETLLQAYLPPEQRKQYIQALRSLGVRLARQLHVRYKGLKEIGADIGLDASLNPWVLEVNTSPDPYIFRRLKDKSIFRRIMSYARAYGKYKRVSSGAGVKSKL